VVNRADLTAYLERGKLSSMARWSVLTVALLLLPLAGCLGKGAETSTSAPPTTSAASVSTAPPPPPGPKYPHYPNDGASEFTDTEIQSFDAHKIPVSIYKPKVADAAHKVPVILQSHGFTGHREKGPDAFKPYIAAGFGVVSFDERGHGDSRDDSEVEFMDPNYEVKDISKIVDTIATWDWVLLDGPGDPRLGGIGGSYGGAFQTMGAIFDPRFDAIVPEITWNDIADALAPHGAIKSGWVDLFYLDGNAQQTVKFSNDFHVGWAWAAATNTLPAGQAPGVPDLVTRFHADSPKAYPGKLRIPALFIQGMPDTLFPLNEAVANLRLVEATGAPTALYTHLHGHILSTGGGSIPVGTPVPVGLQGPAGGDPCGTVTDLGLRWHLKYLLDQNVTLGPRVCLALEDGTALNGTAFPLPGTTMRGFDVGAVTVVPQAPAGASTNLALFTPDKPTVVAGIPHLKGTLTAPGADNIVYFSLQVPGRNDPLNDIVDDQVFPIRVAGPVVNQPFDLDLGGVGVRLQAGDALVLTASTVTPMFFGNAEREPGAVVLDGLHLDLPIVPAP
jgi:hypothetical protein